MDFFFEIVGKIVRKDFREFIESGVLENIDKFKNFIVNKIDDEENFKSNLNIPQYLINYFKEVNEFHKYLGSEKNLINKIDIDSEVNECKSISISTTKDIIYDKDSSK